MNAQSPTQFEIRRLREVYESHENYQVVDQPGEDGSCYVFFSSNSLYFPNSDKAFEHTIIANNRFEWKKNIPSNAQRAIFVRDVYKQWYLDGISEQRNSIDALCDLIREQAEGNDIVCVGSSAGGYAAALIGSLVGAKCSFVFSGQFSLERILKDPVSRLRNDIVVKHENNPAYRKFYDIRGIVEESHVPVFYIYPAHCQLDITQSQLVNQVPNIHPIRLAGSSHGQTCYLINLVPLISMGVDEMLEFQRSLGDRVIHPFRFSSRLSGTAATLKYVSLDAPKRYFVKGINKLLARA